MLYPDENMNDFTAAEGSVSYPGQDLKLQHMRWLFENFLLVSKNVLANKFGMYNDSEEAVAGVVVEAVTNFAATWFPLSSPPIPTVDLCVSPTTSFLLHTRCSQRKRELASATPLGEPRARTPTRSFPTKSQ